MGACYAVELNLQFADGKQSERAAAKALREYMVNSKADFHFEYFAKKGVGTDTFDDLMRILLAGYARMPVLVSYSDGRQVYSNEFDASYSYEPVIVDAFEVIAPYLADNSSLVLCPDNDYREWRTDKGKIRLVRDE